MKSYRDITAKPVPPLLPLLRRRRPRQYAEWKALRRWNRLPDWEQTPPGYLLRQAREEAGQTQSALAHTLGCSQQAVAQAERATANPTIGFIRRWADATGREVLLELPVARPAISSPGRDSPFGRRGERRPANA